MIVNKKFDRLKQWGRERMGGEVRTDTSDEFKALTAEMQLRHEGRSPPPNNTVPWIRKLMMMRYRNGTALTFDHCICQVHFQTRPRR